MKDNIEFVRFTNAFNQARIKVGSKGCLTVKHSKIQTLKLRVPHKIIIQDVKIQLLNHIPTVVGHVHKKMSTPNLHVLGKGSLDIDYTNWGDSKKRDFSAEMYLINEGENNRLVISEGEKVLGFITNEYDSKNLTSIFLYLENNLEKNNTSNVYFILRNGLVLHPEYLKQGIYKQLGITLHEVSLQFRTASNDIATFISRLEKEKYPNFIVEQMNNQIIKLYKNFSKELITLMNEDNYNKYLEKETNDKKLELSSKSTKQSEKVIINPNVPKKQKNIINVENSKKELSLTDKKMKATREIIANFRAYQKDLVKMMERPVLADLSDMKVSAFNDTCVYFELSDALEDTFEKFYSQWVALKNYADITQDLNIPETKRKNFNKAKQLVNTVLDESSSDNEKIVGMKSIQSNLKGVLPLNEEVMDTFKIKVGLKELTGA